MFLRAHSLALRQQQTVRAAQYLNASVWIWESMKLSWDPDSCGGGLWWGITNHYKNAIANELFLALAAGIANALALNSSSAFHRHAGVSFASAEHYYQWAVKVEHWFVRTSGMINAAGLINDGLTADCRNNGGTTWTYNQGVILGGLASLFVYDGNASHLAEAWYLLNSTLHSALVGQRDHVLRESCEGSNSCDGDQCQFKGILMRNVAQLARAMNATKDPYSASFPSFFPLQAAQTAIEQFLDFNVESICTYDVGNGTEAGMLGLLWTGPFETSFAGACTLSSALDCVVAQLALQP
jgi:predicted alpha-1,6-mannanase (GH76 family)